jgi:tRNA (guanosine-2'-O-)-methyltransferase
LGRLLFLMDMWKNLSRADKERWYATLEPHIPGNKYARFASVLAYRNPCLRLVLENIYQSLNASAILRTAESYGVQHVHIVEDEHPWPYNRKIAKGAGDWMTMHKHRNSVDALEQLKSQGFLIATTAFTEDAVDINQWQAEQPVALVMGTELSGATEAALQLADVKLIIPTQGFTQSLNVSVAAGIALHQLNGVTRTLIPQHPFSEEELLDIRIAWAMRSVYWSDHLFESFKNTLLG